ncbi:MAG: 16S rRNA (guanine(527)-N(7))-methyltransferase RsmG [Puniceicoccales bacterium]|jgi:16S rRNA (guanine527-N7)-methyltransferase|nr:16S rRNA (guanine(527)-N(7))-methyltransferase RsmG [Puniceicoccales bacterium]
MDTLARYFGTIPADQAEMLRRYHALIVQWNSKINLISRKDIGNFWRKHILPCLCISKVLRFVPGSSAVDVGTGGGLPGIPLAITNGDVNFTLVDSVGKKILAVENMVKKLALKHVRVINARIENMEEKFDYVVARAVTDLPNFLKNIGNICRNGTRIFYIKGADFTDETCGLSHVRIHNMGELLGDDDFADKVIIEIRNEQQKNSLA